MLKPDDIQIRVMGWRARQLLGEQNCPHCMRITATATAHASVFLDELYQQNHRGNVVSLEKHVVKKQVMRLLYGDIAETLRGLRIDVIAQLGVARMDWHEIEDICKRFDALLDKLES